MIIFKLLSGKNIMFYGSIYRKRHQSPIFYDPHKKHSLKTLSLFPSHSAKSRFFDLFRKRLQRFLLFSDVLGIARVSISSKVRAYLSMENSILRVFLLQSLTISKQPFLTELVKLGFYGKVLRFSIRM